MYPTLQKSGYIDQIKLPAKIIDTCKFEDINAKALKEAILSSFMGHVVFKTDGPKKVEALLWD